MVVVLKHTQLTAHLEAICWKYKLAAQTLGQMTVPGASRFKGTVE